MYYKSTPPKQVYSLYTSEKIIEMIELMESSRARGYHLTTADLLPSPKYTKQDD